MVIHMVTSLREGEREREREMGSYREREEVEERSHVSFLTPHGFIKNITIGYEEVNISLSVHTHTPRLSY